MVDDPARRSEGMVLLRIQAEKRAGTTHFHLRAGGLGRGAISPAGDQVATVGSTREIFSDMMTVVFAWVRTESKTRRPPPPTVTPSPSYTNHGAVGVASASDLAVESVGDGRNRALSEAMATAMA